MSPVQICPQKQRLSDALLEAANAVTALQQSESAHLIEDSFGLPRIDLESARAKWRDAKRAFFAHVYEHG